jgi:hypothetical protein
MVGIRRIGWCGLVKLGPYTHLNNKLDVSFKTRGHGQHGRADTQFEQQYCMPILQGPTEHNRARHLPAKDSQLKENNKKKTTFIINLNRLHQYSTGNVWLLSIAAGAGSSSSTRIKRSKAHNIYAVFFNNPMDDTISEYHLEYTYRMLLPTSGYRKHGRHKLSIRLPIQ